MTMFDDPVVNPLPIGVVASAYIPGPAQTDAVASARATQLGVTLGSRTVSPAYAPYVGALPGLIGTESGVMYGYATDAAGQLTKASCSALRNDWQATMDDRVLRYNNKQSNRGATAWGYMDSLQYIMNRPTIPGGALTIAQLSDAARKNQEDIKVIASNQRKVMRWLGDQWDKPD